jgi:hypothetical protein
MRLTGANLCGYRPASRFGMPSYSWKGATGEDRPGTADHHDGEWAGSAVLNEEYAWSFPSEPPTRYAAKLLTSGSVVGPSRWHRSCVGGRDCQRQLKSDPVAAGWFPAIIATVGGLGRLAVR